MNSRWGQLRGTKTRQGAFPTHSVREVFYETPSFGLCVPSVDSIHGKYTCL